MLQLANGDHFTFRPEDARRLLEGLVGNAPGHYAQYIGPEADIQAKVRGLLERAGAETFGKPTLQQWVELIAEEAGAVWDKMSGEGERRQYRERLEQ